MGTAVFAAPGEGGNGVQVHSEAVDRLTALGQQLVKNVNETRAIGDWVQDQRDAAAFLGGIRMLRGITDILADQPGYAPDDKGAGAAIRARMQPIQSKVHEITDFIEKNVGLGNPLPVTAKKKFGAKNGYADTLLGILLDEQAAKDAVTVAEDKTIPESWKTGFFEALGIVIGAAMEEVLKTNRDAKLFDTIVAAVDTHNMDTLFGAAMWAGQAAASAGGNLPGPTSLYVAGTRWSTILTLKKYVTGMMTAENVADEVSRIAESIGSTLSMTESEKTTFASKLKELGDQQQVAKPGATKEAIAAAEEKAAGLHNELKVMVRKNGMPSSGRVTSAVITMLNVAVTLGAFAQSWDHLSSLGAKDAVDLGASTLSTFSGICATAARTKWGATSVFQLAERAGVGTATGCLMGVVSIIDGGLNIQTAIETDDWWLGTAGGLQIGSGLLIVIGVLGSFPGTQAIGVAVGLVAAAILVLETMFDDPLEEFVKEIVKQIKECRSTYDQSLIMDNVGLSALVAELEALVKKTKIAKLDIDWSWKIDGKSPAQQTMFARLKAIGLSTDEQLKKLTNTLVLTSSPAMSASAS
jgi:hypothetical protein